MVYFGFFRYVGNFCKYGDFSYGVYIVHFPVIQILLWTGFFESSHWLFLSIASLITLLSAYFLWHGIEKRFLSKRSYYMNAP